MMRLNLILKLALLAILFFLLPSTVRVQESPDTYWQTIDTSEELSHQVLGRGYLLDATLNSNRTHILYVATTGLYYQNIESGKIVWQYISNEAILDAVISPSGDTIAFLQDNNFLFLLNSGTGEQQDTFALPSLRAISLKWNPDRDLLAIADTDGRIYLWDTTSNQPAYTIPSLRNDENLAVEIDALAWSPDGTYLAAGDFGGRVFVWSLDTQNIIHQTTSGISIRTLRWSSDSAELAIADQRGNLVIRSFPEFEIMHRITSESLSSETISGLSYSPENTYLAAGIENEEIIILSTSSYERFDVLQPDLASFRTTGESRLSVLLAWLSENRIVQITATGSTYIRELDSGIIENWQLFVPREEEPTAIAITSDGERFAFGTRNGAVYTYNLINRDFKIILEPDGLTVNTLAWSPDMKNLAIGRGQQVLLWNAPNPGIALYDDNHNSRVESVVFSKDNLYLASGSSLPEPEIIIRNLRTFELEQMSLPDNLYGAMTLTFSPDSQQIAVGTSNEIRIQNIPSLENVLSLSDLSGVVVALEWEDSETLFWIINSLFNLDTGEQYSSVYRVDLPAADTTEMTLQDIESPIQSFAMSNNNVISSIDREIIHWSFENGFIFNEHKGHTDTIKHIAVSFETGKIISISEDGTVRIWNITEQETQ